MEPFKPLDLEQEIMEYWDKIDIFQKVKDKNKEGKKFYYLDGPPYVNGHPHMGHARTRAIRDPILKYRVMKGQDVNLQPGYDCHGLPIEVKVEEELGLRRKEDIEEFGAEKFIDKCKQRALKFVDVFNDFYKRFGLHWDFENPYKTLDQSYINSSWAFFKKAEEEGLLYKGKATTAWCPRCETALAGYEATDEYRDVTDNSIYVKFKISRRENEFILVWTTTPWTLPANLAVTVNPKYEYVFVQVGAEKWLMAKELVETVMEACGIDDYEITGEPMTGKEIEGLKYDFVLADSVSDNADLDKEYDNAHKVLLGDFVTLEDGTGCVHTAPGHGQDDYSIGMRYGLPAFSPVGENGLYTKEGGSLKGVHVFKANDMVIDNLKSRNLLVSEQKISHRYAHCWRCKTPIIYRASPQWFVSVDKVKDLMIRENEKVNWLPEWAGEKRFSNWVKEARDWCISRQRYWGIPLPIWECECGERQVFGSFEELKEAAVELPDGEPDLHVPYTNKIKVKCSKCGKKMSRVPDITDIWFESGAATWASLGYPQENEEFEKMFPMDFITEGLDQTRGWFYTIMLEGIIMFEQTPYHNVLMNEWVLDKNGDKMSKSLGNVTAPSEVMDKYGADITRFYLLEEIDVWEKLRFNMENVKITFRLFNTLWNCYQFVKTYMQGFDPRKVDISKYEDKLRVEDAWILSRLNTVNRKVTDSLENYLPYDAVQELDNFVMNDLSRWYIKVIRDRTWVSAEGEDKEAAITTLYMVLSEVSKLMAPFSPFISEYMYRELIGGESVFLGGWPESAGKSDEKLEKQMELAKEIVEQVNAARSEAGIKLRWPVEEIVISTKEDLEAVSEVICNMSNSKKVCFSDEAPKNAVEKEFTSGKVMLSKDRSPEIVEEGLIRDLMRQIQNMRKKEKLDVSEEVVLKINTEEEFARTVEKFRDEIMSNTTSKDLIVGTGKPDDFKKEANFEGKTVWLDYE
jgi:isoleucyl-tRNA synthetase